MKLLIRLCVVLVDLLLISVPARMSIDAHVVFIRGRSMYI